MLRIKKGSAKPKQQTWLRLRWSSVPDARDVQLHAIDAGAAGDVKRLAIFVAPGDVGNALGHADGSDVLAFRGNNPDTVRTGGIQVPFFIHAQAIGNIV